MHTTERHRFWDGSVAGWVEAGRLVRGHRLVSVDGAVLTVAAVVVRAGVSTMYDLTVDEAHSYYVGAGDHAALVHNCGGEQLHLFDPEPYTTHTPEPAATEAVEIPGTIYRGGGSSPSNLKMRPGEDALSFRDSLSNPLQPGSPVLHPGRDYIGIDTSKLPPGSVVPDGEPGSALTPPGHVSVYVTDPDVLKAAIIEKGKFPK